MKRQLVYIILFLMVSGSVVHAQLISNGGFEDGNYTGGVYNTLGAGSNALDSWSIGLGGIDWIESLWQPHSGSKSVDLNAGNAGSISQSFSTVAGDTYMVSFYLAGNPEGGDKDKTLDVSAAGTSQTFSFDITGHSTSNMGWVLKSFEFDAVGTTTTLTFASANPSPYGPALDDVLVEDISNVVGLPEPSALGLLACGMVGLLVTRRRLGTL